MKNSIAAISLCLSVLLVGCSDSDSPKQQASAQPPSSVISLPPLTSDEKSELDKIQNAGNLAGQLGHEITQNIKLIIGTNNFGEKLGCIISIQAQDPNIGLVHPRWNLRVQIGKGAQTMVWTPNGLSNNAGEVRLIIGGERYSLANRIDNEGGRGMELNTEFLNNLLSSESAKAVSGMLGDTEISNTYDLRGFKKAYKFAVAICA